MRNNMKRVVLICILLTMAVTLLASAGQYYAGKGYLHTSTAATLPPGALDLSFFARAYVSVGNDETGTISNGSSALGAAFGFTRHAEIGFTQILYQDLNATFREGSDRDILTAIPGDTYIRFKISGYQIGDNILYGFAPAVRYRVSNFHDVHLEPYESNGIELEVMSLWSYFEKPLYPDEGYSVHANIGLLHHNDTESPSDAAIGLPFLASFLMPGPRFDYGAEIYGSFFLVEPPENVFGRENWMYVTPLVRYKLFKGLQFTMGLDILALGHDNTTLNREVGAGLDKYPNYSTWRISGRVNFSPSTAFYVAPTFKRVDERGTGRERHQTLAAGPGAAMQPAGGGGAAVGGGDMYDRQELFRWAIEERFGGKEAVDVDLEKIRKERMRAEEQLKELKKELEEKDRKGK